MLNTPIYIRRAITIAGMAAWLIVTNNVMAFSSGISGFSGATGSTCTACHLGGSTPPTVTISADTGAATVSPESVTRYTVTLAGGPAVVAGLDVAASSGMLTTTGALTKILNGEVVHSQPSSISGGTISWGVNWQAPAVSGTYTLYATSLSANGDGGSAGDSVNMASLEVTVSDVSNQLPVAAITAPATGVEGQSITFDGSGSFDSNGTILSYDWDFGDGNNATGDITTHVFTAGAYNVTLTVTDDSGNTDAATHSIQIAASNVPPTAVISGATNGTEGIAMTFDGSGSMDPDGTIVNYDWNFGDNTAGAGINVNHSFAAGTYTITLQVTDDLGATDSVSLTINITAGTEPQPPMANAGGPYSGTVNTAIPFNGSGSTDTDGTIATYHWDFGDGNTGTGVNPQHMYNSPGIYNVVLTVTDNDGLEGQSQTTADINAAPTPDPTPTPGQTLYNRYCASCHGDGGTGGLEEDVIGESTDDIFDAIDDEPTMAFLSDILSNTDVDAIADFLNPNNHQAGETLYNTYCASCHGIAGTGGLEEDVVGESAEDIREAIEEEPTMVFLSNMLNETDINAIGRFLNKARTSRDFDHEEDEDDDYDD